MFFLADLLVTLCVTALCKAKATLLSTAFVDAQYTLCATKLCWRQLVWTGSSGVLYCPGTCQHSNQHLILQDHQRECATKHASGDEPFQKCSAPKVGIQEHRCAWLHCQVLSRVIWKRVFCFQFYLVKDVPAKLLSGCYVLPELERVHNIVGKGGEKESLPYICKGTDAKVMTYYLRCLSWGTTKPDLMEMSCTLPGEKSPFPTVPGRSRETVEQPSASAGYYLLLRQLLQNIWASTSVWTALVTQDPPSTGIFFPADAFFNSWCLWMHSWRGPDDAIYWSPRVQ